MPASRLRHFLSRASQHRSIRLTAEGFKFVLLSIGIGVASINTGNNLLYLLFAMMLSLIVISGILSERSFKQVQISRRLPPALFANQPATAAFVIVNRSARRPIFSLRVMDLMEECVVDRGVHLLHLPPNAMAVQSYPMFMTRRGLYRLNGFKLLTRFPFGLFVKSAMIPVPSELLVYPEVRALPPTLVGELSAWGHDQTVPQRGQGTALYNLRLYQPGDDSRTIHWKTTARKSLLIVRETEAEDQRRVTIVLQTDLIDGGTGSDTPSDLEARFEKAVSLAASLAVLFTKRGYEIRLVVGDRMLAYEIGDPHLMRMLSLLAVCRSIIVSSTASQHLRPPVDPQADELIIDVLTCPDQRLTERTHPSRRILFASECM